MTPGQKQMIAIRDLIEAEINRTKANDFSVNRASADLRAHGAFVALCEAFGHEVPTDDR